MLGQALGLALRQLAVVALDVTLHALAHRRGLGLPEGRNGLGSVEPTEEQVAAEVVALFQGLALGAEVLRALGVDRQHLIGHQAQVVLGVGVADAVAQAALVVGTDVRHTKTGAANLGAGLLGLRQGMGATAEA